MSTAPLLVEQEKIVVLDFGSPHNQMITRTIREFGVYSELHAHTTTAEQLKKMNAVGIIIAGGPDSLEKTPLSLDSSIYDAGIPVLGINNGMQAIAVQFGGTCKSTSGNKDLETLSTDPSAKLYSGQAAQQQVLLNNDDQVDQLPAGFYKAASTPSVDIAAMGCDEKHMYGVQYYPEVEQSEAGEALLRHFIFNICEAKGDWSMESFIEIEVEKIRATVGDQKVLCALSGGVDSSVVAALIHRAIGDQLTCMFVDHGLLRKGEADSVVETFSNQFHMNFIKIDASERFLSKLAGVSDPEQKRKIIGNEFIYVFDDEAAKLKGINFLAQGTIYADIIESGTATAQTIKSHHNVGGLPEDMDFELIEPLTALFKDEVRKLGAALGLPDEIVHRQPFPGPGLGVRVLGEITKEKLEIVRESDWILRDEIKKAGLDRSIWQYFTVLPDIRSVGVRDEKRTYDYAIGIRAVHSVDGMTSDWARIPWDVIETISRKITSQVPQINRVLYDVTTKPPATIEWE